MLWPFYLGVSHYIYQTYDVSKIKILCSSAGCFGGVSLALGLDPHDWCQQDWRKCLKHFSSRSLGPLFDSKQFYFDLWDKYLPPDAHIRASGKLFISLTLFPSFRSKVVSQFDTREDLINCIVASVCFPLVFLRSMPNTSFGLAFDGGLTNDQPCLDSKTVTVSALNKYADIYPSTPFNAIDIIRVPDYDRVWSISEAAMKVAKQSPLLRTPEWNAILRSP
eukprot:TRINITY_DN6350_c0_g1_i13.p1 TRINITY_DN6350_c0_g1~~TRINITY_DN6350_c0_g1_i13.p1  ORF type:complete len:221 (+),score=33.58 TRINITY_DN6350_c0_g1_i13:348-1010(+)